MIASTPFDSCQPATIFQSIAYLTVKTEHETAFRKALNEIIKPTQAEAANLKFDVMQTLDNKQQRTLQFEVHELWLNQDALFQTHLNTIHMKTFFATVKPGNIDGMLESERYVSSFVETVPGCNVP